MVIFHHYMTISDLDTGYWNSTGWLKYPPPCPFEFDCFEWCFCFDGVVIPGGWKSQGKSKGLVSLQIAGGILDRCFSVRKVHLKKFDKPRSTLFREWSVKKKDLVTTFLKLQFLVFYIIYDTMIRCIFWLKSAGSIGHILSSIFHMSFCCQLLPMARPKQRQKARLRHSSPLGNRGVTGRHFEVKGVWLKRNTPWNPKVKELLDMTNISRPKRKLHFQWM